MPSSTVTATPLPTEQLDELVGGQGDDLNGGAIAAVFGVSVGLLRLSLLGERGASLGPASKDSGPRLRRGLLPADRAR
jgi:hypothetical protein